MLTSEHAPTLSVSSWLFDRHLQMRGEAAEAGKPRGPFGLLLSDVLDLKPHLAVRGIAAGELC